MGPFFICDEPRTLSYQITLFGTIGADVSPKDPTLETFYLESLCARYTELRSRHRCYRYIA